MSFSLQHNFSMDKFDEKFNKANLVNFYIPKMSQENIYNLTNNNTKLIDSDIHKIISPYSTIYLSKFKKENTNDNNNNKAKSKPKNLTKTKAKAIAKNNKMTNYITNPNFQNLSIEKVKNENEIETEKEKEKENEIQEFVMENENSRNLNNQNQDQNNDDNNINLGKTNNNPDSDEFFNSQSLQEQTNLQIGQNGQNLYCIGKSLDDSNFKNLKIPDPNELQKPESSSNILSINPNSNEKRSSLDKLNLSEKNQNIKGLLHNNNSNPVINANLFFQKIKKFSTSNNINPYKNFKILQKEGTWENKMGNRRQQLELIKDYRKTFQTLDNFQNKEKLNSDLKYYRSNKYMVRLGEIKEESLDNQYNKLVYSKFMKVYSKPKIDFYWGNHHTHKNLVFLNELININSINHNNLKKISEGSMSKLPPKCLFSKRNDFNVPEKYLQETKYGSSSDNKKDTDKHISLNSNTKYTFSNSLKQDTLCIPFQSFNNPFSLSELNDLNQIDYSDSKWLNRTNRLIERLNKLKVVKNRAISQALKVDSSKQIKISTNVKDEIRSHINRVLQKYNKMLGFPKSIKL